MLRKANADPDPLAKGIFVQKKIRISFFQRRLEPDLLFIHRIQPYKLVFFTRNSWRCVNITNIFSFFIFLEEIEFKKYAIAKILG